MESSSIDDNKLSRKGRRRTPATAGDDEKPVRILTNFTAYDRNHNKEMVAVNVCEIQEGAGRDLVVVGYARPKYKDKIDEDDDLDEVDEEDLPFLQLSAVLKLDIKYTNFIEPVWIKTSWAWYRLETPSKQYEPMHTHFMFPESVAQVVLSNAKHHRKESLRDFLDKFKNMRYALRAIRGAGLMELGP
jgi:DNA (cytosine-5)-methyltransferase 1